MVKYIYDIQKYQNLHMLYLQVNLFKIYQKKKGDLTNNN